MRGLRGIAWGTTIGWAVAMVFYALSQFGADVRPPPGSVTRPNFDFSVLPKPEEFGWLVGTLAAVCAVTFPRPRRGPWWAWGALRGATGGGAIILASEAIARGSGAVPEPRVLSLVFWVPIVAAFFLSAAPLDADGEAEAPAAPVDDDLSRPS